MHPVSIERILVAVDFSSPSETALQQAIALGKLFGATVTAAHVLTDLRGALGRMPVDERWKLVAGDIDEFEKALRHDSDEKLARLRVTHWGDGRLETVTLLGTTFAELIRAVQQRQCDLLIAGTQGMSAVKKWFVGSTAGKLVHYCPTPVWIVPTGALRELRKILVPVDFSEVSAKALAWAGVLAARTGARLYLLHVLDDADLEGLPTLPEGQAGNLTAQRRKLKKSSAEHLREFAAQHLPEEIEPDYLLAHGRPWQLIDSNAKRLDADLIALGSVGRGGLTGMLLGNTAERVLNHTQRPLLVVKPDGFVTPVQPSIVPQTGGIV